MKKLITLLLGITLALAITACGNTEDTNKETGPDNSVLIAYLAGDPQGFHPDYRSDDYAMPISQNVFNRLVKLGPNDNVILDLAESYEFSEDGMQLTFKLRDGVRWHDGEPFTSADVKWTYDTMIQENWSKADSLASVESIECPDDLTVVMNLKNPDVSIISKLSWYGTYIVPKHLYEGQDTATCEYNMNPIGTGPYKFVEFEQGVKITLEANEDFFGGAPKIQKLIFSIQPDQNTAYESYVNKEIDYFTNIPKANIHDFDNNPDYQVYEYLSINRTYMTFNFEDEIVGNPLVRQAINLGVDREGIYTRTMNGTGAVAKTFISPLFTDFVDDTYQLPSRDIEAATKLLEEAGYQKDKDGYYFTLDFDVFISGNYVDVATVVVENLKDIGIKVRLNVMEYGAWLEKITANHDFQVTMFAGYQGPDVSGIAGRVHSKGGTNYSNYGNPELDRLLDLSVTQTDVAERAESLSEVQRILSEDLPMVILVDNGGKVPVRSNLAGTPYQIPDLVASVEMSKAEFTY